MGDWEADSPFPLSIDSARPLRQVCKRPPAFPPVGDDETSAAEFVTAHAGVVWTINERGMELVYLISLAPG